MRLSAEERNIKLFIEQNFKEMAYCSVNLYELKRVLEKSKSPTISDLIVELSPKGCSFKLDRETKVINIYNPIE